LPAGFLWYQETCDLFKCCAAGPGLSPACCVQESELSSHGAGMSFLWMAIITLVILQISVLFTTIYLHRYKTHKGMELHPVVGLLMHLELSLFTGVVPRQWAAVHRKHHHFRIAISRTKRRTSSRWHS
jgi:hypothetical protein